jgi:hypothetical protein
MVEGMIANKKTEWSKLSRSSGRTGKGLFDKRKDALSSNMNSLNPEIKKYLQTQINHETKGLIPRVLE